MCRTLTEICRDTHPWSFCHVGSGPIAVQVFCARTFEELTPLAGHWNRLARGVPFRSWAWMSGWWRHYGLSSWGRRRKLSLFTLVVLDEAGLPIGIVPWYCRPTASQGRVLRFLGADEVCGDYLSVLCQPGRKEAVTGALADWLTDASGRSPQSSRWDLLELTGVDAEDAVVGHLAAQLSARGHVVHRRPGSGCWRIELPAAWEDYLAILSKSHRKQLRRMERNLLRTGRVAVHFAEHLSELDQAAAILVDLHRRRRQSLGQSGSFASASYLAFHRQVMPELLTAGQLQLSWISLDEKPVAAEYHLASSGVVYAYQSGVDPEALPLSPGRLSHLVAIRRAIEQGYRAFDFLRGDEPYKAHWRGRPRATVEVRVAAARPAAWLRHGIWLAGSSVKQWLKSGLVGLRVES